MRGDMICFQELVFGGGVTQSDALPGDSQKQAYDPEQQRLCKGCRLAGGGLWKEGRKMRMYMFYFLSIIISKDHTVNNFKICIQVNEKQAFSHLSPCFHRDSHPSTVLPPLPFWRCTVGGISPQYLRVGESQPVCPCISHVLERVEAFHFTSKQTTITWNLTLWSGLCDLSHRCN